MIDFSAFGDDSAASRARRATIAGEIGAACRETGFFALTGHGIDATMIDGAFAMAQNFFDLPEDKKRRLPLNARPAIAAGLRMAAGCWIGPNSRRAIIKKG